LADLPNIELPEIEPGDEVIKETVVHNEVTDERSVARRLALQALYEVDSVGHEVGGVMNGQIEQHRPVSELTAQYMRYLVTGVSEHRSLLDAILRHYASEFPLSQIAIVDRNILRIAALEFAFLGSTPIGVAIDEAVELAKLFGAEGSPRFINGVLGALADDRETLDRIAVEFAAIRSESSLSDNE
jgi:transcription antitermination protein NusB